MKKKPTNTEVKAIEDPAAVFIDSMFFGSSKAIEMSEEQGQKELVESEVLPTDFNGGKKEDFEKIGIKFGKVCKDDPIFQEVVLPDGWKKVSTEHSMWSDLVDDKGRKRASIFYKAAFYDRSAHIYLVTKFSVDAYKYDDKAVVSDGEKELVEFEHDGEYQGRRSASDLCRAWLGNKYPDYENATAYWND